MSVCWKTRLGKCLLSLCRCIPCCSDPTVDEDLEEEFQRACSTLFEVHFFQHSLNFTINIFDTNAWYIYVDRQRLFFLNGIFIFLSFFEAQVYFEIAHFLQLKFRSIFTQIYQKKKYVLQKKKITNHDFDYTFMNK